MKNQIKPFFCLVLLLCAVGIGKMNAQANTFGTRDLCGVVFDLYDSYGDGWQGNKLTMSYEGGYEEITLNSGSSDSQTLFFPDGVHITLGWVMGDWTSECSFNLHYANGNVIYYGENLSSSFSFEFDMDCEEMPTTVFNIIATAHPTEGGLVTGNGTFEAGQSCAVTAMANEGYAFMCWTENGDIVSTDAEYSFVVTGDRGLVANFGDNTPIDFVDDNVKALCLANWDYNGDGELSYGEAAAVTDLDYEFYHYDQITSFDELQYFIGLTSIGEAAFAECWNLSSIVIPNSVTSIGGGAFSNCWNLPSIEIPNAVTSIGDFAFRGCTSLTSMMVASCNTYYDSRDNCNAIIETATNTLVAGCKNTVIPNSVISIGDGAFFGCLGLTSVEIPNSVTSIGSQAFEGCTGMTSVTIGNSVTSIGYFAFQDCSGLTSVEIPNSVTSIGDFTFRGCTGLTSMMVASGNTYYDSRDNCNAIIETATNTLVEGCKNSVIPNTITSIEGGAFYYCTGLTSVEIPNSVTFIGGQAFEGCTGLTSMTIGNSVTSIGYAAFQECAGLTSVEIPNAVTSIGPQAFIGCSGLTSVTIPSSVTYVGYYAFSGCDNMTSAMVLAETPPEWDYDIFDSGLFVYVPCGSEEAYTSIGWGGACNIFGLCDGTLTVEAVPAECGTVSGGGSYAAGTECTITATANDGYAFSNWTLNGNVVSTEAEFTFQLAGDMAFVAHFVQDGIIVFADENVKAICVANWDFDSDGELSYAEAFAVTDLGNWWGECPFLDTDIGTFDELQYFINLTSIGEGAFAECDNLSSITIPNSVTSIGGYAFYNCPNLTSIEIPNSVTFIWEGAFSYCTSLTEITMLGTNVPSLRYSVFDETNDCPIYVPYESLNDYKTAENWNEYEYRIYPWLQKDISGYGEGEGQWHFIASPLTANTEPTAVSNMIGISEYDLYRFNQSAELEWENYKVYGFSLANGQGYLYANEEDASVIFKGEFNEEETKEVNLVYDEGKDFAGWNLVGNPFPEAAYANRSYYTMNVEGTAIEPNAVSTSTAIPACTGIMVKADTTGENVTFSKTAPSAAANNGNIKIAVVQANTRGLVVQDKAIVSFNAGDELGKFSFGENDAKLFIPQNGMEMAIATAIKTGEMPLNFKAARNGEYTLSFKVENVDLEYLHLIDNLAGNDIDLLVTPTYTFEAKTSDYASRFRLVFSASETDGSSIGSETSEMSKKKTDFIGF